MNWVPWSYFQNLWCKDMLENPDKYPFNKVANMKFKPDWCSECNHNLTPQEMMHNGECGIDLDEWICHNCEMQYADDEGE